MHAANDNSAPGWMPTPTASLRLWLWFGSYLALPLVLGIVLLGVAL